MATQWTAGLSDNTVLPASTLNTIGAVWENYTPTWTATVTNPVLGNGTIAGRYARIQKWVIAQGWIVAGSTTTYGAGGYLLSLPITANISNSNVMAIGHLLDASAGYINYTGGGLLTNSTTVEFRLGNASAVWQPTNPITLANADQFRFWLEYEAA